MAGDWLKFDKATPDKPEVFAIAGELGIDPDAVVGKLMRVWSWFDTHTENGNARSVTSALLDRIAGVTGFVSAMQKSGWIEVHDGNVSLPNFDRHCGETAKKRAQNNKRVSDLRVRNANGVTFPLQKHVPEKRREEKKEQKPLADSQPQGFIDFWLAYPKQRREKKAESLKVWNQNKLEAIAETIISHVKEKSATHDWQKDDCQFVPQPPAYLRGKRWQDGNAQAVSGDNRPDWMKLAR